MYLTRNTIVISAYLAAALVAPASNAVGRKEFCRSLAELESHMNQEWMENVNDTSTSNGYECACSELDMTDKSFTVDCFKAVTESSVMWCNSVTTASEDTIPVTTAATASTAATDKLPEVEPTVTEPSPAPETEPRVELIVTGSVLDYSSFDYCKIRDGSNKGVPDFYNAQEVMDNEDENNVLGHVIRSFGSLINDIVGELFDNLEEVTIQFLPVVVSDVRKLEGALTKLSVPFIFSLIACTDICFSSHETSAQRQPVLTA